MTLPRTVLISRLILENKGKILLLAQTNKNGGKHSLPGGKVELNETPIDALIRESKEEADIELSAENLELVHLLHRQKGDEIQITMYFKALRWHGNLRSKEPKKFKNVAWISLEELPKNLSKSTRTVLINFHKGIRYSEVISKKTVQKRATI